MNLIKKKYIVIIIICFVLIIIYLLVFTNISNKIGRNEIIGTISIPPNYTKDRNICIIDFNIELKDENKFSNYLKINLIFICNNKVPFEKEIKKKRTEINKITSNILINYFTNELDINNKIKYLKGKITNQVNQRLINGRVKDVVFPSYILLTK